MDFSLLTLANRFSIKHYLNILVILPAVCFRQDSNLSFNEKRKNKDADHELLLFLMKKGAKHFLSRNLLIKNKKIMPFLLKLILKYMN
jgi:hypothetical protein